MTIQPRKDFTAPAALKAEDQLLAVCKQLGFDVQTMLKAASLKFSAMGHEDLSELTAFVWEASCDPVPNDPADAEHIMDEIAGCAERIKNDWIEAACDRNPRVAAEWHA